MVKRRERSLGMHITFSRFKEKTGLNNSLSTMTNYRQSLLFDKQSNIMCKEENYAWIEEKERCVIE